MGSRDMNVNVAGFARVSEIRVRRVVGSLLRRLVGVRVRRGEGSLLRRLVGDCVRSMNMGTIKRRKTKTPPGDTGLMHMP